ncbi:MAG: hypothetical protein ACRBBN_01170 [Methyloligellaceae bacterium]
MLNPVLTKEFFPDFKLPKHPSDLDRNIQQIIDADNNAVRLTEARTVEIMWHYLKDKTPQELHNVGYSIVNNPGKHMLWLLTSNNIEHLIRKMLKYIGEEDFSHSYVMKPDQITIYAGRVGFSGQWKLYNLFYNLALLDFTISGEYELSVDLTEDLSHAAPIISDRYTTQVNTNASEPSVTALGEGITARSLITSNPELDRVLAPDFKFAILPEDDDILEPAKTVLRENIGNPEFDLGDLARLLCVSPRTVQRKLKAAGTTFMALKNEERISYITTKLSQGNAKETLSQMAGLTDMDEMHRVVTRGSKKMEKQP